MFFLFKEMDMEESSMLQDLYQHAFEAGAEALSSSSVEEASLHFCNVYKHILHARVHAISAWLCGFYKLPFPRFSKLMQQFSLLLVSALALQECEFLESRMHVFLSSVDSLQILYIMEEILQTCCKVYNITSTSSSLHESLRMTCMQHIVSAMEKRKMYVSMEEMHIV